MSSDSHPLRFQTLILASGLALGCQASVEGQGRSRLRRMTRSALKHTVRDLLGTTGSPADAVSPDESIGPLYSNAIAPVTDLIVQQYDEVAAALADRNREPHAKLLVSISQLMGLDVNGAGDRDPNSGPLAGLV